MHIIQFQKEKREGAVFNCSLGNMVAKVLTFMSLMYKVTIVARDHRRVRTHACLE